MKWPTPLSAATPSGFLDIPRLIRRAMADATRCSSASLDDYLASDAEVRRLVADYLNH